jgi:hypothetical protein
MGTSAIAKSSGHTNQEIDAILRKRTAHAEDGVVSVFRIQRWKKLSAEKLHP